MIYTFLLPCPTKSYFNWEEDDLEEMIDFDKKEEEATKQWKKRLDKGILPTISKTQESVSTNCHPRRNGEQMPW